MNTLKNKKILSIAIILILSLSAILAVSSTVNAQLSTANEVFPTWTFISVTPPIDGVGQQAMVVFWLNFLPPTAQGQYGDRWTFMVNVVKPDGTNDTLGPFGSDPVGSSYTSYVPTETGQYEFQAIFQQHVIDGGKSRGQMSPEGPVYWPGVVNPKINPIGQTFLTSMSQPQNITVQSAPLTTYQETPLPNDYWTRPVYDTNRQWSETIMGEWYNAGELAQYGNGGRYNPFTTGPASAHILWTSPYWDGGIAGGLSGLGPGGTDVSYYSGQSYESYGSQPFMVLNGKAYVSIQTNPREGWYELNLVTGQRVYYANTTGPATGGSTGATGSIPYGIPAFGQILDYESPNQHGTEGYFWVTSNGKTSTWDMYDDYSNQYICSIANTTWTVTTPDNRTVTEGATGTSAYGVDGSILRYNIVNLGTTATPSYYLQIWNTTQAILAPAYQADMGFVPVTGQTPVATGAPSGSNTYWEWRPQLNYTYNGRLGLSANVSIPTLGYTYSYLTYSTATSTAIAAATGNSLRMVIPDNEIIGIVPG